MFKLHIESKDNPQIYRKILISPERNFLDLDFTVSIVFELIGSSWVDFTVLRTKGEVCKKIVISAVSEGNHTLEPDEEPLKNWFVQPGDEILCHIAGFASTLKIQLDQIVDHTPQKSETVCLEAEGSLMSNKKGKIKVEDMNIAFSMQDALMDSIIDSTDNLIPPNYLPLFELSDQLRKMKPWQFFENEEIIALELESFGETFFVSVMGAAGQEYGLMIYDDDLGYTALSKILSRAPLPEDFHYDLFANVVGFVDRDELEPTDYELIKSCGLSYRGKNNWIQFRSYEAGKFPSIPEFVEIEFMTEIVAAMIRITELCKEGWRYPTLGQHTYPAFEVHENREIGEMYVLEMKPSEEKIPLLIEINDIEKMQFKRKPKHNLQVELDLFYLPFLIQEEMDDRPVYPLVLAVMDRITGEVISHEVMPFPKLTVVCQQLFWAFLHEFPVKPSKVFVSKDMKNHLAAVAKEVGIELVESELPGLSEFKEAMKMMPPIE